MDTAQFMEKTKTDVEKAFAVLESLKGLATQLGFPVVDQLLANTIQVKSNLIAALDDTKAQALVGTFLTICPNGECRQWDSQSFEQSISKILFRGSQDIRQYITGLENKSLFSEQELTAFKQLFESLKPELTQTRSFGMSM